jgi:hypothetical protein
MLTIFLIFTFFLNSDSFILLGNNKKKVTIFYSRLFEREEFIRQGIEKKKELKIKDIEEVEQIQGDEDPQELSNVTLIESNNSTIRSGRSLDQDGKTNIWSVEPTMIVDESDDNDLLKIIGIFCSVVLVTFQFFLLTNPIFPDPSDY